MVLADGSTGRDRQQDHADARREGVHEGSMQPMQLIHIDTSITDALECSVFLSPRDPGLTVDELIEVGSRLQLQRGEILDSIGRIRSQGYAWGPRIQLPKNTMLTQFFIGLDPDYRNPAAFDFVATHLREIGRRETMQNARAPRDVIVASAEAAGLQRDDVEAAITLYLHEGILLEDDGFIAFAPGRGATIGLPSQLGHSANRVGKRARPYMGRLREAVQDVIRRRQDGRPPFAEPLPVFEARLESLGHGRFQKWWTVTCSELRQANPAFAPITVCVLAAALAEGALTFVVKHARALSSPTLASKTFDGPPNQWSFADLLKSAAAGGTDAIFDQDARARADRLFVIRQRIHAGRLLAEVPTGPIPDTRPEEAREALQSLDVVVRRILDWLDRHPVTAPSSAERVRS
jgi:hypothetical protein